MVATDGESFTTKGQVKSVKFKYSFYIYLYAMLCCADFQVCFLPKQFPKSSQKNWSYNPVCQVPSAYFLADVFLHLDLLLEKKLLRPNTEKGQTRMDRACEEAVRGKRCLGALRYLWRNSRTKAHDPNVQEMKSLLEDSPLQRARGGEGDGDEGRRDDDDDAGEGDLEELESQGGGGDEDGEGGDHENGHVEEAKDDGSDVVADESDAESDSVLRAPTLRLGEESPPGPNSDGEWPDSQRHGAWMSKMYTTFRTLGDSHGPASSGSHKGGCGASHDHDDGDDGHGGDCEHLALCDGAAVTSDESDGEMAHEHEPFVDGWVNEIIESLDLAEYLVFQKNKDPTV